MNHRFLILLTAIASLSGAAIPEARADRLGGNYRGPEDTSQVLEDSRSSADRESPRDPLLADLGLGRPFVSGFETGRKEAAYRGRPLLVFWVLPGCDLCETVARGTFRDVEILDLAARYVPAVANADREEVFGVRHGVRTIPTILLLDAAGRETGRVEGTVDPARVAALLREGIRKFGSARPAPEARTLERTAAEMAKARETGNWRTAIAAARAVERIGHDGPELDRAREARRDAAREADGRMDAAMQQFKQGERTEARRMLERVARDFEGIEQSVEATVLLQELGAGKSAASRPGLGSRPVLPTDSIPSVPQDPAMDPTGTERNSPPPSDPPPPDP